MAASNSSGTICISSEEDLILYFLSEMEQFFGGTRFAAVSTQVLRQPSVVSHRWQLPLGDTTAPLSAMTAPSLYGGTTETAS